MDIEVDRSSLGHVRVALLYFREQLLLSHNSLFLIRFLKFFVAPSCCPVISQCSLPLFPSFLTSVAFCSLFPNLHPLWIEKSKILPSKDLWPLIHSNLWEKKYIFGGLRKAIRGRENTYSNCLLLLSLFSISLFLYPDPSLFAPEEISSGSLLMGLTFFSLPPFHSSWIRS